MQNNLQKLVFDSAIFKSTGQIKKFSFGDNSVVEQSKLNVVTFGVSQTPDNNSFYDDDQINLDPFEELGATNESSVARNTNLPHNYPSQHPQRLSEILIKVVSQDTPPSCDSTLHDLNPHEYISHLQRGLAPRLPLASINENSL